MKRHLSIILLLSLILLVACAQSNKTLLTQTSPQPTATLDSSTATATEGIRVGITVIPPATWSPTPTSPTKTPTPTWKRFLTRTPKPTGTATPPVMAKLRPVFGNEAWRSPDGQWLWTYEAGNSERDPKTLTAFYVTHFVSVDGLKEWKVQLKPSYFENFNGVIGSDVSYKPLFWLPNEPYVYLIGTACCVDGFGDYFFNGRNMARLNLNTGEVTIQVPGWKLRNFTFSENGMYLLDGNYYDGGLKITRLYDGQLFEIPLPATFTQSGMASFSPDNNLLVIQSCVESEQDPCRLALLIVDIKAKNYRVVIPDLAKAMGLDKFIRTQTSWASNSQVLILEKIYGEGKPPRQWLVDIITGDLSELK